MKRNATFRTEAQKPKYSPSIPLPGTTSFGQQHGKQNKTNSTLQHYARLPARPHLGAYKCGGMAIWLSPVLDARSVPELARSPPGLWRVGVRHKPSGGQLRYSQPVTTAAAVAFVPVGWRHSKSIARARGGSGVTPLTARLRSTPLWNACRIKQTPRNQSNSITVCVRSRGKEWCDNGNTHGNGRLA